MADLHIKLIHEQQKTERQVAINEQQDSEMRDLNRQLKVGIRLFVWERDKQLRYYVTQIISFMDVIRHT